MSSPSASRCRYGAGVRGLMGLTEAFWGFAGQMLNVVRAKGDRRWCLVRKQARQPIMGSQKRRV